MGDNTNYYSHNLSFSGEEYNIVCESNIGVPGIFIFKMGKNQKYLFAHIFRWFRDIWIVYCMCYRNYVYIH